jgi:anthranilate synthase component 2/putative glutamine amidotransferase
MPGPVPRPLIGVTTYRQDTKWWSWDRDAAVVPGRYLDMVVEAGGWPVLIPSVGEGIAEPGAVVGSATDPLIDALDGLVVIGGGDVSAARYGQEPDGRNGGVSDLWDDLELRLLDAAVDRDLPLLAICRGHQVLNVLFGGTLVQQLPDILGSNRHQPRTGAFGEVTVITELATHVHRLLGPSVAVLCSHHQAIDGGCPSKRGSLRWRSPA